MGKIKKAIVGTLSLISLAAGTIIGIKNIPFAKTTEDKSDETTENIDYSSYLPADVLNEINKNIANELEVGKYIPIRTGNTSTIVNEPTQFTVFFEAIVNRQSLPKCYFKLIYNNTNEFYQECKSFGEKDLSQLSQEDIYIFFSDMKKITTSDNLNSIESIEIVKNDKIASLSKKIVSNSLKDEDEKQVMNASVSSVNIVGSSFIAVGSDPANKKFVYQYNGTYFYKGKEYQVSCTIKTKEQSPSIDILSELLNEEFNSENGSLKVNIIDSNSLNFSLYNSFNLDEMEM